MQQTLLCLRVLRQPGQFYNLRTRAIAAVLDILPNEMSVPQYLAPSHAAIWSDWRAQLCCAVRVLSVSAQNARVFWRWHARRLMIRAAPAMTASSLPCMYLPSWHAVTRASAADSWAAERVGWYVSANMRVPRGSLCRTSIALHSTSMVPSPRRVTSVDRLLYDICTDGRSP